MAYSFRQENIASIVLKRPHITEKATDSASRNAYVFVVDSSANKLEIKKAVEDQFKVKPVKVNIISVPQKKVFSRKGSGFKKGFKKAVVYLKEGDKIDIA